MLIYPYQHDCEQCIWVGWLLPMTMLGNVYYCKSSISDYGTICIRFGNVPNEYLSLPIGITKKGPLHKGDT